MDTQHATPVKDVIMTFSPTKYKSCKLYTKTPFITICSEHKQNHLDVKSERLKVPFHSGYRVIWTLTTGIKLTPCGRVCSVGGGLSLYSGTTSVVTKTCLSTHCNKLKTAIIPPPHLRPQRTTRRIMFTHTVCIGELFLLAPEHWNTNFAVFIFRRRKWLSLKSNNVWLLFSNRRMLT